MPRSKPLQSSAEIKIEIIQLERQLKAKRRLLELTTSMEELMLERTLKILEGPEVDEALGTPDHNSLF